MARHTRRSAARRDFGTGATTPRQLQHAVILGLFLRQKGALCAFLLVGARLLLLPFFDDFLPWSALAFCMLLALRFALLAHEASAASMREALDHMPEGVLFAKKSGNTALVNITLLRFMEMLFGTQYRNTLAFWQALENFSGPPEAATTMKKNAFLLRFSSGDA